MDEDADSAADDSEHTADRAAQPDGVRHGERNLHAPREAWGVNAAIGAASIAARTAGDVAGAVTGTTGAKVLDQAARWITRPLSREGEEARDRIGHEGVPAAQEAIRHATPGVVQAIDIDEVLAAIDVDALLDRIDVNRIVDRIDVGAIVSKVDVDALVQQVDVQAVVAKVDIDALLESIDLDALLSRIDIGSLVGRIDLDQLLAGVDIASLVGRIDLDQILAAVDLDALLSRIDINALMDRLDMDALVANTELGGIIARSTSGVASEALDAVRSQGVGIDNFIARLVNRAMRRDQDELPQGPPLLTEAPLALPAAEAAPTSHAVEAVGVADS